MRTLSGRVRWRRSAHRITSAPATNAQATGTGANSTALIALSNTKPSTAAGTNATARLVTKRWATGSLPSPRRTAHSRARNSQHTATIAPAWITISNTFACSPV